MQETTRKCFFVVMDVSDQWPRIIHMQTTTASKTIVAMGNLDLKQILLKDWFKVQKEVMS